MASLKSTFPSCFITHTGATRSDFGVNTCETASVSHPPSLLVVLSAQTIPTAIATSSPMRIIFEALAKPPPKTATTERGPPKTNKNGLSCTGGTRSVASAKGFASDSFVLIIISIPSYVDFLVHFASVSEDRNW
jgi:hypothetical protein